MANVVIMLTALVMEKNFEVTPNICMHSFHFIELNSPEFSLETQLILAHYAKTQHNREAHKAGRRREGWPVSR